MRGEWNISDSGRSVKLSLCCEVEGVAGVKGGQIIKVRRRGQSQ